MRGVQLALGAMMFNRQIRTRVCALAIAAACVLSAGIPRAGATTYTLSGASATFGADTVNFTGNFTFDPATDTLTAVNITITGPADLAVDNLKSSPDLATGLGLADAQDITFTDQFAFVWTLRFLNPLGSTPDSLVGVFGSTAGNATSAAGEANPTPLPAALPLFATGLAGLGLISWRRKRKAQAVA
jgi:hypothetical protein